MPRSTGLLQPGGTIVEGTAGNTGIGLALVANAKGYKTIIVMPETQSREKMDTLRALGAELVLVPAAPYSNPGHFVHTSRRIAEETPNAIWANQFDNIANRKAHILGTAEEIWAQMDGRIDGFTCAAGTGGTIAGVGLGLKAKDEKVTHRAQRSARRGALQLLCLRRAQGRGHRRSPKASARGGSPPIWKARRSTRSSASPTRKGWNGSSGCSRKRGSAWAFPRASMWPAQCGWRASWGRATAS